MIEWVLVIAIQANWQGGHAALATVRGFATEAECRTAAASTDRQFGNITGDAYACIRTESRTTGAQ